MPLRTSREVFRRSTFIPQLIMTIAINFGINFGFAWASYSDWGAKGHSYGSWPRVAVWRWSHEVNSCIGLDLLLTSFFISCFCTLLGTGGAVKDVKDKKTDVMDPAVTTRGLWRFTPVNVSNLCLRSLAMGAYFLLLAGLPTVLITWIALQGNTMAGLDYVVFKGVWAAAVAVPVYVIVYFAAISAARYPEIEFESLMREGGLTPMTPGTSIKETPPLVANIGHV